jgi:hypothetical protein
MYDPQNPFSPEAKEVVRPAVGEEIRIPWFGHE